MPRARFFALPFALCALLALLVLGTPARAAETTALHIQARNDVTITYDAGTWKFAELDTQAACEVTPGQITCTHDGYFRAVAHFDVVRSGFAYWSAASSAWQSVTHGPPRAETWRVWVPLAGG